MGPDQKMCWQAVNKVQIRQSFVEFDPEVEGRLLLNVCCELNLLTMT